MILALLWSFILIIIYSSTGRFDNNPVETVTLGKLLTWFKGMESSQLITLSSQSLANVAWERRILHQTFSFFAAAYNYILSCLSSWSTLTQLWLFLNSVDLARSTNWLSIEVRRQKSLSLCSVCSVDLLKIFLSVLNRFIRVDIIFFPHRPTTSLIISLVTLLRVWSNRSLVFRKIGYLHLACWLLHQ